MPAMVVQLMRASSAASEGWDPLLEVLRSSLDARTHVLVPVEEIGFVGCTGDCLRWGRRYVAPRADWKLLVGFWMLGDGFWKVKLGFGGLRMELAVGLIFLTETGQLFVVEEAVCGGCEG